MKYLRAARLVLAAWLFVAGIFAVALMVVKLLPFWAVVGLLVVLVFVLSVIIAAED